MKIFFEEFKSTLEDITLQSLKFFDCMYRISMKDYN